MGIDWQWPGARWWRCDLHVHSPASKDFQGEATAEEWVEAARRAGLDVVAVTDHNSAAWVEKITAAAGTGLTVFPGVELTVDGGTHLLALFEPEGTRDQIIGFLRDCKGKSYWGALGASHEAVSIAPHITSDKGIFNQHGFGEPLQDILTHPRLDAVEVNDHFQGPADRRISEDDRDKLLKALAGDLADYRRARGPLPVLVSSDAHRLDHIGRRSTWIKMTEPTLEGLRLALVDGQPLSVRNEIEGGTEDPNEQHAETVIEGIEVRNLKYMGRGDPFKQEFNPWLNAIVGGRGTGKSTLVECLRLCLRRERELPEALREDLSHFYVVSEDRDGKGLLTPESEITVVYRKGRDRYRLHWREAGGGDSIERWNDAGNEWESEEGLIHERFPARIFSQKQVFELARDRSALLRLVDEDPAVGFKEWEIAKAEKERAFLALRAEARSFAERLGRESSLKGELADLERKLAVFEEAGHAELLKRYQRYRRERRELEQWLEALQDRCGRVKTVAEKLDIEAPDTGSWLDGPGNPTVGEVVQDLSSRFEGFQHEVLETANEAERSVTRAREQIEETAWRQAANESQQEYDALVQELAQEGVEGPAEYGHLVQRRQALQEDIARLGEAKEQKRKAEEKAETALEELLMARRDLTRRRRKFLESVLSGGTAQIQARVVPYWDKDSAEPQLRQLLGIEGSSFEKDVGQPDTDQGILGALYPPAREDHRQEDPGFEDFEKRLADEKERLQAIARGDSPASVGDQRFATRLQALPPEQIDRLMLWFPADALEISYSPNQDGHKFKPIDQASPGQKTAALLTFLLSYGNEPIILDQPEDDLDNHLIYDLLVQRIREMKTARQVIVVTHNPNIVVHGDAELVVSLDQARGCTRVIAAGGLQEKKVRDEVCKVMEGGEEAFRRRYQRIVPIGTSRGG